MLKLIDLIRQNKDINLDSSSNKKRPVFFFVQDIDSLRNNEAGVTQLPIYSLKKVTMHSSEKESEQFYFCLVNMAFFNCIAGCETDTIMLNAEIVIIPILS